MELQSYGCSHEDREKIKMSFMKRFWVLNHFEKGWKSKHRHLLSYKLVSADYLKSYVFMLNLMPLQYFTFKILLSIPNQSIFIFHTIKLTKVLSTASKTSFSQAVNIYWRFISNCLFLPLLSSVLIKFSWNWSSFVLNCKKIVLDW